MAKVLLFIGRDRSRPVVVAGSEEFRQAIDSDIDDEDFIGEYGEIEGECVGFVVWECDATCDCKLSDMMLPARFSEVPVLRPPSVDEQFAVWRIPLGCTLNWCVVSPPVPESYADGPRCGDCDQFGGEACGAQDRMAPICPDFLEMI